MKSPTVDLSEISAHFDGVASETKIATVLRNIDISEMHSIAQDRKPQIGDVLLAKVKSVGSDKKTLQNENGRDIELHEGDKILVAYGNRYAVEEYEALIPDNLGECHLVSGGGVAAKIREINGVMGEPTIIDPIGLVTNKDGNVMNTRDFAMTPHKLYSNARPITIAVLGTGMDAGKTTSATSIVKGMKRTGLQVGFGKMTGTGLSSDIHKPQDAGAVAVSDFVDMGYPSTYKVETAELNDVLQGITSSLSMRGTDINIIEMADGALQSDNQKLLKSEDFKAQIDGVFVAADTGGSCITTVKELDKHGFDVLGVGGRMMLAPLSVREFERHIDNQSAPQFGALDLDDLEKQGTAKQILAFIHENNPDVNYTTAPDAGGASTDTAEPNT